MPDTDAAIVVPGRTARRFCGAAADELFPRTIEVALGTAGGINLADGPDLYCRRCGQSSGPHATTDAGCPACLGRRPPWRRVVRLGAYRPPLSDWIVAMKFAGAWQWGPWLGRRLAEQVQADEHPRVTVCAVPLHWRRRWQRRYDQAQLIAAALADARGWPTVRLLRRVRHTQAQTRVAASDRTRNIRGAFGRRRIDLTGWHVWLVDDVKTTGSTLTACARLLRRSGAVSVSVAVAAVAER